jgi:hypothetical protein
MSLSNYERKDGNPILKPPEFILYSEFLNNRFLTVKWEFLYYELISTAPALDSGPPKPPGAGHDCKGCVSEWGRGLPGILISF